MTTEMIELIPSSDSTDLNKFRMIHRVLDDDRKACAAAELYERAANLRDVIKILSDHILGYDVAEKELMSVVYYACVWYGECVDDDENDGTELYLLEGTYFQFGVN